MNIVIISLTVVTISLFIILVVRRYKDKLERTEISLIVDIMTILIGVASLIASAVSIAVMLSQEKTQEILLEAQMREHQPIFSIDYTKSKSPSSDIYDVQDFVIENIGEQMISPAKISHKSFIKVDYNNVYADVHKSAYYPLSYYYNGTVSTDNLTGRILMTIGNEYLQNNLKMYLLHQEAMRYDEEHKGEYISLEHVDYFVISYTDIYGEERTNYYRESHHTTKEEYEKVFESSSVTYKNSGNKSISEVTLNDLVEPLKINEQSTRK